MEGEEKSFVLCLGTACNPIHASHVAMMNESKVAIENVFGSKSAFDCFR